jgi:hypothetical protein
MVINTSTDVQRLQSVEKVDGTRSQPANADLQREAARGFTRGGSFDTDSSSSFPITVDPLATVCEILLPVVASDIEVVITTTNDDVITLPITGPATIDSYRIDSFKITDPTNQQPRVAGAWAGDE